MTDLVVRPCHDADTRVRYVSDGPIDFESWLQISFARDRSQLDTELVRGVLVQRLPEPIAHGVLFGWLLSTLGCFVDHRKFGIVLGCRTAVKITAFPKLGLLFYLISFNFIESRE